MSEFVEWMGAQAEIEPKGPPVAPLGVTMRSAASRGKGGMDVPLANLPLHNFGAEHFPAEPAVPPIPAEAVADQHFCAGSGDWEEAIERNPDLWMYRDRMVALLRRYMRFSLETGRLPSMAGKEFFRAKVSSYPAATFEDRVIFVSDVEKIMGRLEYFDQQLIARMILQEHNQEKAARLLHCNTRTVQRRLPEVLDLLSEGFLAVGLLAEVPPRRKSQ